MFQMGNVIVFLVTVDFGKSLRITHQCVEIHRFNRWTPDTQKGLHTLTQITMTKYTELPVNGTHWLSKSSDVGEFAWRITLQLELFKT